MAKQTSPSDIKAYTAGNFALILDDGDANATKAYLKSIEGGNISASIVDEPMGQESQRIRHVSLASIEPFSAEFGFSGAKAVLAWIQQSWNKDFSRRNGQVSHADFNLNETYVQEFYDALLLETTFPTLDGSSKDPGMIKIKFQPERVTSMHDTGNSINDQSMPSKQKMWLCSSFRLSIDGLDELDNTNRVESFTIKQGIKTYYTGAERFPQIEPTKLEFPNITGSIALGYSKGLHAWYQKCLARGASDPSVQRGGQLEFLAPDRKSTLFRINLSDCGLLKYTVDKGVANSSDIKRVKFEVLVNKMELDFANY